MKEKEKIKKLEEEVEKWKREVESLKREVESLKREVEKLKREATHDFLTHLLNRRGCREILKIAVAQAKREDYPLAIFSLDVDNFKKINDSKGYKVGDKVLRALAKLLTKLFRGSDILSRWGGDEFLLICPEVINTKLIRKRIAAAVSSWNKKSSLSISLTIGESIWWPREDKEIERVIDEAVEAMRKAKQKKKEALYQKT